MVRGQGGEGKTALAAEFARWMVRSQQVRRAAFVSVESHSHSLRCSRYWKPACRENYSVATFEEWKRRSGPSSVRCPEQSTLLVVDNMESVLLPLTRDARGAFRGGSAAS